ncbi:MAG: hypothetical protein R3B48_22680 [Kofleriaceae bacterium]
MPCDRRGAPRPGRGAVAPLALALALATPARAEVQALIAGDCYLATIPGVAGGRAGAAALSAHLEWSEPEQLGVLDWVNREDLFGGPPRRELHELNYVERRVPGVELTLGRFRVPGGFWLIADGVGVAWRSRSRSWVAGVFGGSRSFTNGRSETMLTSSPTPLPLAGASVTRRGQTLQASASFIATSDLVVLYRGDGMTSTKRTPEQFLDAELAAAVGEHGFVTAGLSLGSRYLVTFSTSRDQVTAPPELQDVSFGAQSAYALGEWRLGAWRLQGTASAVRTKLGPTADPLLATISGSYGELGGRVRWHPSAPWRLEARYRFRRWADARLAQRAESAATWRRGALELSGRLGVDAHRAATDAPGLRSSTTLFYRASAARKTTRTELATGAAAVASIGDELALSPGEDARDQRAPFTLQARSYAFARAFLNWDAWFGGAEVEVNLRGDGVRALFQVAWSR